MPAPASAPLGPTTVPSVPVLVNHSFTLHAPWTPPLCLLEAVFLQNNAQNTVRFMMNFDNIRGGERTLCRWESQIPNMGMEKVEIFNAVTLFLFCL